MQQRNNVVFSKHISPTNSEDTSPRKKFLTVNQMRQPIHHDRKMHLKSVDISKSSVYANNKPFDSNYSENGSWLDSKFASNKSKDPKDLISKPKEIYEETIKYPDPI